MKRPYIVHVIVLMMVITVSIISCNKTNDPNMDRILVITGGHDFEPSLYDMFDSFETVQYDTIIQPNFNKMISKQIPDQYLALVFYDMYQEITEDQQKAFLSMLEKGQGIVFLHHALVSYQHWDEFINIVYDYLVDMENKSSQSDEVINTRILKSAGFEGVDLRNTEKDGLVNGRAGVGSVLFDIKPGTIELVEL